MSKVTVSGNIVSRNGITLFFSDGTSQVLPNEGFKTKAILEAVLPSLSRMEPIEIDLDAFSITKILEKTAPGLKISEENGNVSISTKHGTVKDASGLKQHIEEAAWGNGGKGLKIFLGHFAEMSKERKHSADELLTFLKGADLPIADDGSIIGYKILGDRGEHMVDHHSGKVTQKLGSIVFMPASKITGAGREACGVGLHIAAKSYLSGFWNTRDSRLCLVKIKASDVISVPPGERSKMRVCAYHIVKVLSREDGEAIARGGKKIEEVPSAAAMLADVVVGNHTPITQRVEITGAGALTVTDLVSKKPPRKRKAVRPVRKNEKVTVATAKAIIIASTPYEKKLAKAQKDYDRKMSIRDIAKKYGMDREALGKNLKRETGR